MKEVLYTIPVNDAFHHECECPICSMHKTLEDNAIEFAMGPSYMEDDIRLTTDKIGFCQNHMQKLYDYNNRLGLALIMNTHMQNIIKDVENLQKKGRKSVGGLFGKKDESALFSYTNKLSHSCYVCEHINNTFERYIATVFYLYEKDQAFRTTFQSSKGFCVEHYGLLYELAPTHLNAKLVDGFTQDLNNIFLSNMKRMQEDVDWFINKFDYRYANADWKTSKDALPRGMTKLNGILMDHD